MSGKMFLLYAEKTGNVLAAASMNAPPDGTVLPNALAGDGLMLRNLFDPASQATVHGQIAVPVANLAIAASDPDEAVLADPMASRIGDDKRPTGLDPTKKLTPTLAGTTLKVAVPATVTQPTPVLVCAQAAAGGVAKSYAAEIALNGTDVSVALDISASGGTYILLVLAEGYLPAILAHLFP